MVERLIFFTSSERSWWSNNTNHFLHFCSGSSEYNGFYYEHHLQWLWMAVAAQPFQTCSSLQWNSKLRMARTRIISIFLKKVLKFYNNLETIYPICSHKGYLQEVLGTCNSEFPQPAFWSMNRINVIPNVLSLCINKLPKKQGRLSWAVLQVQNHRGGCYRLLSRTH